MLYWYCISNYKTKIKKGVYSIMTANSLKIQYKNIHYINLVEAMGIEPMSALQITPSTTCLFFDYTHINASKAQHYYMRQLVILLRATKLFNLARQFYLIIIRISPTDRHVRTNKPAKD